jgi:2-dehydropantoate 2-reductase
MKNPNLSFLVIGAGAIGGITAAFLKKAGFNVEIVCKYDEYATLISESGINVTGIGGNFNAKIPAYSSLSDVRDKKDIILLATKATDMLEVIPGIKVILKENGYLISLQNGICEDTLGDLIGHEKIIGCVTGWGATMENMGNLIMTSTGDFIIGYPSKEPDDFLVSLAETLSSVVPVITTDNISGHLYSKLIINSCITSLGAVCGLYLGKMLSIAKIRRIFIEIIKEAIDVAAKMNIKVEIFNRKLDFLKFLNGDSFLSRIKRHILIMIIGFKYRRLKSSSLQSLERGKLTEIDYLNGYITRNADKFGIPVPVNKSIVRFIHEIEQKKRSITVDNFNDPAFEKFN